MASQDNLCRLPMMPADYLIQVTADRMLHESMLTKDIIHNVTRLHVNIKLLHLRVPQ